MLAGTRGSCRRLRRSQAEVNLATGGDRKNRPTKATLRRGEKRWRNGHGLAVLRRRTLKRTLLGLGRDGFCMGWNGRFGRVAGGYIVRMDRDACLTRYFQPSLEKFW